MRVDRAERQIRASAEEIYRAFVDRAAVAKWLPPRGARATLEAFEPRAGGAFRMKLTFEGSHASGKSGRDTDVVEGTFDELTPGKAVVQRFHFESDDPDFAGLMTMRWTFEPNASGTHVSVAAENVPRGIDPADHRKGMESSLENLAAYVERN